MDNVEVPADRILAVLAEENPQALALAARRARIEMLEEELAEARRAESLPPRKPTSA
jgi:stringent starvation protein B